MEEIDVKNYPKNKYCAIHKPNDEILVFTNNDLQFLWVRREIARLGLEGYYLMFEGIRYNINKHGFIENIPNGLFDIYDTLNSEILQYGMFVDSYDVDIYDDYIDKEVIYEQVIRPNGEIIN